MQPVAKPPISCLCRSSHGRTERAVTESIATGASCRKPAPYDQATFLERKLVSGCSLKRVRSLFGRMDGSNRTVGRRCPGCTRLGLSVVSAHTQGYVKVAVGRTPMKVSARCTHAAVSR